MHKELQSCWRYPDMRVTGGYSILRHGIGTLLRETSWTWRALDVSTDSSLTTASAIYTAWRTGRRAQLRQLPDDVALHCERHVASPYRDLADILLGLFGPRRWRWIDASGEERRGLRLPQAVIGVARDLLTVPFILAQEYWRARAVLRRGRSASRRNKTRAPLYLRMDHIFDLAAGGSVAHTSGLINALRELAGSVTVLSTDRLAMVAPDERFHVVTPRYGSGRNIPLIPLLTYNDQVLREWRALNEVPGFVYARYSLGNYAGPMIAQRLGIPYVCEYNGSNIWIARNWGTRPLHFEPLMALIEDVN